MVEGTRGSPAGEVLLDERHVALFLEPGVSASGCEVVSSLVDGALRRWGASLAGRFGVRVDVDR